MMRAALGDAFRYCEFYTEPNCCQTIPCARIPQFERTGFRVFLQKSHDHELADPIPAVDLILVQTREPILRALSNYELDLESHRRAHSMGYLYFWLAREAHYIIGFCDKWIAPDLEPRLLLSYERLITEPLQTLGAILRATGILVAEEAIARGAEQLRFSARDRSTPFKPRGLSTSPYLDPLSFGEFAALLLTEGGAMGYDLDSFPLQMNGPVTAIFAAMSLIKQQEYRKAVAELEAIMEAEQGCREILNMLARAMVQAGRANEARAIAQQLVEQESDYFGGYALCADEAYGSGAVENARHHLQLWMDRSGDVHLVRSFLNQTSYDPEFLNGLPLEVRSSVSRASVTAGFRWILGREPESEAAIQNHMRCLNDEELRQALFRSEEFMISVERINRNDGKSLSSDLDRPLRPEDAASALQWILGRNPNSQQEIQALSECSSAVELRTRLMRSEEFLRTRLAPD